MITIGCQTHSVVEWRKRGREIAKNHNLTKPQQAELKIAFEAAVKWMKLMKVDKVTKK